MSNSKQTKGHVGLASKLKIRKQYTNYVSNGGPQSFDKWKKNLKINKK